ncbi:colicin E3-like toxin immunity protein [Pseudomonas helleri]|uniref:Cloacin n=1 Tax=Pseudomonas helleri TaxID=1608996 RepID=A0A6A7YXN9_9PSED|nr:colicin E3-like toxin immunity protein [Pseudomonas helleri]MQT25863.1 cloacin [Pseudomonas helleri]MQT80246.1 cloacin [Pseudomonas helleri]MQU16688.1 cloacin [Pseudomonas helleri]MQU26230.1 cloacin [Pseudomonas helleri]
MGLTVELSWYDKKTEFIVEDETSEDFGKDCTIVETLGLSIKKNVNNGCFDVGREWLTTLQPLFVHRIDLNEFDYQVSFNYKR